MTTGRPGFLPRVVFADAAGQNVAFVSGTYSTPAGDAVKVVYSANQPSNAQIDSFFEHWGLPLLLGFMGGIFTFLGIGSMVSRIFLGGL